ncbi:MAG: hypothetical protein HOZ81_19300 [Streptomyces sp.]|nr:hypothetical protein [Streptomyces sp.]
MNSHDPFEPFDDLEAELTALGALLDVPSPPPSDVAAAVRTRLDPPPPADTQTPADPADTETPADPETPALEGPDPAHGPQRSHPPAPGRRDDGRRPPARRARRNRWKIVTAAVIAVIAVTAATPQGRAAVAGILRFAGIELQIEETPPPPVRTTAPLPGEHTVNPEDLSGEVKFKVRTPSKLGTPHTVTVSDEGRVVSMLYAGGIRLDQFAGGIDPFFFKKLGPPWPDYVQLDKAQGWWIPGEHPLGYIHREDGTQIPLRQAAPTLIWQQDTLTYRLEGVRTKEKAVKIAESLR